MLCYARRKFKSSIHVIFKLENLITFTMYFLYYSKGRFKYLLFQQPPIGQSKGPVPFNMPKLDLQQLQIVQKRSAGSFVNIDESPR